MDSKVNHREGFSIPQETGFQFMGSWAPITPEKPMPTRSNFMPVDRNGQQLGRTNWKEMNEFHSGYAQEVLNNSKVTNHFSRIDQVGTNGGHYIGNVSPAENGKINQITGPFTRALLDASAGWNDIDSLAELFTVKDNFPVKNVAPATPPKRTVSRNMSTASRPLIPDLHSQVSNWRESSSQDFLVSNQTHHPSSKELSSNDSLAQLHQYGYPRPYCPNYYLNSTPRTEADAASSINTSFHFPPVKPDHAKKRDHQVSPIVDPSLESSIAEKSKQHDLVATIEHEATGHNSVELPSSVVASSSAVVSTPFEEAKDSDKRICEGIDLNKTPQQKTQKRRKHRPKVIVEAKQKKSPKAGTTKVTDSKKPRVRRKYVRREDLKKSVTQYANSIQQNAYSVTGSTEVAIANITNSNENPSPKRKYVPKKGLQESETQHADSVGDTTNPDGENTKAAIANITDSKKKPTKRRKYVRRDLIDSSSCRRALNFDQQNVRDGRQSNVVAHKPEMLNKGKGAYNLNTGFQAAEVTNGANMTCGTKSALQINRQMSLQDENRQFGSLGNFASSMNQMPRAYVMVSEREATEARLTSTKMQMQNLTRNTDTRMLQQNNAEGIRHIVFPRKTSFESLERTGHLMSYGNLHSISRISSNSTEDRESKRDQCHIERASSHIPDLVGSSMLTPETFQKDYYHQNCSIPGTACTETHKKKRIENGMQRNMYGMPSFVAAVKGSRQETKSTYDVYPVGCTANHNPVAMNFFSGSNNVNNSGIHKFTGGQHASLMASGHNLSNYKILYKVHNSAPKTTIENCGILPSTPHRKGCISSDQLQNKNCNMDTSRKQQTIEPTLSNSIPSIKGWTVQEQDVWKDNKPPYAKQRGRPAKEKFLDPVEEITNLMAGLNLKHSNGIGRKEQNELVPFEGYGAVVPYEGFEFIKKRKPRPKVDLDPETDRVWKLLMWKEGSEGLEGKEKEEWWEEERKVFRGRADSFIARMHLVQGDRRFSRWKGSVVDSVIGVFLTQNVSDHLSSSAFMSLAAQFPLRSMENRDKRCTLVEEPDSCILKQSNPIKWHENLLGPSYYQSSLKTTQLEADGRASWRERASNIELHGHSLEEEVLSPQDSSTGGFRSSSGSNSEAEDPASGCKCNNNHDPSSNDLLHTLFLQEFYSHNSWSPPEFLTGNRHGHQSPEDIENGQKKQRLEKLDGMQGSSKLYPYFSYINPEMQVPAVLSLNQLLTTVEARSQVEGFKSYGEESISSWASTASRITEEKEASCTSKRVGQGAENMDKISAPQLGTWRFQGNPILYPHVLLSQQQVIAKSNVQTYNGTQQQERNMAFQLESTKEAASAAESMAKSQNSSRQHISTSPKSTGKVSDVEERTAVVDKQTNSENKLAEPNSKEQGQSTNRENIEANKDNLGARKRKVEGEKKSAVDWERLRQQVQTSGVQKQRSADAMDSLDYEALRCASTKEISETIKERGMNNMLAERIKDFLNRLVRDHGSVDLEWLRDVPPEKAKEYLLSVRGLGLKSVECVRLLTLHHLAFPVDTNVGRIAVRLGWVPLQPLPESLQLHLLELYPVLETIQKYLWPRLCKLDQRTLYELHYQLITFGKVFCTKSRPNCNACPMRAECRHFASAFASARLALPGPEEKRITTSTIPFNTERNPGIVINPMPLPPPEDYTLTRVEYDIGCCVPIVEEPATPEQDCTEVTQSDIEDAFNEDPDEIPTIKLNMEEFTVNVQNYMQANLEIQEADMSKALVALNPGAASIPTPKLKNVSRLRTEHQVYELPDSHPLLRWMDRREPDDPSPYLLAIWTPGETANSIQPPESVCQSQGLNKLCNEETCYSCSSIREANSQTVRGTILIPCRTAMRGSFPLNGTYFQVNEVFADHESSINPIDVPRSWIWNLPRRIVYFGTSVSSIFKGLSTEGIQYCFWKGFVCVRGFDQKTRAPRPLMARLHFPASKLVKAKNENQALPGKMINSKRF